MEGSAVFSECGEYRYFLSRCWDKGKKKAVFIGLNPSKADETESDNTVSCCINLSKSWGFGGIYMLNLFAYMATEREDMLKAKDPEAEPKEANKNISTILDTVQKKDVGIVIACWGNDGSHRGRSEKVKKVFLENNVDLRYSVMTEAREPHHPLYIEWPSLDKVKSNFLALA